MFIISIISLVLSILSLCKIPNDYVSFTLFIIFGLIFYKSLISEANWITKSQVTTPKLTFRQFITMYEVMPDRFILNEYNVFYKRYEGDVDFKTYFDFLRYKHFKNNIEKHEVKMNQLNRQAELIKALHRDLANMQKENDDFMKQKLREQAHIIDLQFKEKLEDERSDSKQDP